MAHSQSELRKSHVKPVLTISSFDKNASSFALLYEMLQRFKKRASLFLIS